MKKYQPGVFALALIVVVSFAGCKKQEQLCVRARAAELLGEHLQNQIVSRMDTATVDGNGCPAKINFLWNSASQFSVYAKQSPEVAKASAYLVDMGNRLRDACTAKKLDPMFEFFEQSYADKENAQEQLKKVCSGFQYGYDHSPIDNEARQLLLDEDGIRLTPAYTLNTRDPGDFGFTFSGPLRSGGSSCGPRNDWSEPVLDVTCSFNNDYKTRYVISFDTDGAGTVKDRKSFYRFKELKLEGDKTSQAPTSFTAGMFRQTTTCGTDSSFADPVLIVKCHTNEFLGVGFKATFNKTNKGYEFVNMTASEEK